MWRFHNYVLLQISALRLQVCGIPVVGAILFLQIGLISAGNGLCLNSSLCFLKTVRFFRSFLLFPIKHNLIQAFILNDFFLFFWQNYKRFIKINKTFLAAISKILNTYILVQKTTRSYFESSEDSKFRVLWIFN